MERMRKPRKRSHQTTLALASTLRLWRRIEDHAFSGKIIADAEMHRDCYVSRSLREPERHKSSPRTRTTLQARRRARHIGVESVSGLKSLPCCLCAGMCGAGGGTYCFWVGESFRIRENSLESGSGLPLTRHKLRRSSHGQKSEPMISLSAVIEWCIFSRCKTSTEPILVLGLSA